MIAPRNSSRLPVAASPAPRARAGFTLIELLTVIAIIGVLAALIIPTLATCRAAATKSREVSAARQMMTAFQMAAEDRKGVYLSLRNNTTDSTNEGGNKISMGEAAARWPHHLRPYLGDRFKATLYVNAQADYYDETLSSGLTGTMLDYTLSMGTSFGFNGLFVGAVPAQNIKDAPVRRIEQAALPSKLIAFASAASRAGPPAAPNCGYFKIESPAIGWPTAERTGANDDPAEDAAYGYVSYRLGGKAAVVFLDGHVELLSSAQLRDMRLWSDQARRRDDPNYRPAF